MTLSEAQVLHNLREEFVHDPDRQFDVFREHLLSLHENWANGLRGVWKVTHSLKGTAQAIGLQYFATLVSELEDSLEKVEADLEKATAVDEQTLIRLESRLAECLHALESYLQDLEQGGLEDTSALKEKHETLFAGLRSWSTNPAAESWGMDEPAERAESATPQEEQSPLLGQLAQPGEIIFTNLFAETPEQTGQESQPSAEAGAPQASQPVLTAPTTPPPETEEQSSHHETAGKPQEALHEKHSYLLLQAGKRSYALPMEQVVEIIEDRPWCALPIRRKGILGVVNRFGEVLPIIEFPRRRANCAHTEKVQTATIVVCLWNEKKFGIPAESVSQIVEISTDKLQSVDSLDLHTNAGFSSHVTLLEEKTVSILDLARLME